MFKIGQKVVCIKEFEGQENSLSTGFKWTNMTDINFPIKGEIYTVSRICSDGWVVLKEFGSFISYDPEKLRPIQESETFAEETLKNIAEQIEQEQLVLI